MTELEERVEKYAETLAFTDFADDHDGNWPTQLSGAYGHVELKGLARAVVAVADAELSDLTVRAVAAEATLARLEAVADGHAFSVTTWDTGVRKCPHPSHLGGYSASCHQAWLAEQLAGKR